MSSKLSGRLASGIDGLDQVLKGGYIANRSYMVRGRPGSGKTILALHFLNAGIAEDESGLFINLEEDLSDLKANAATLGFDTGAIRFLDLSPSAEVFTEDQTYDVFTPSEVEQGPFTEQIVDTVHDVAPERVVVDPLTQLRYLTSGEYQFRKQVIGFLRFLKQQGGTVVFTVQDTDSQPTDDLEFMTDGTIHLDDAGPGKLIRVPKFRGSGIQGGDHAFRVTDDGIQVYPALEPREYEADFGAEEVSSGVPGIDDLLYGGLTRGTVSVISGPTGVGKTTLGTQFMNAAADRGERSVIYLFEESKETFMTRSEAIGIPVEAMVDRGTLQVNEVEALEQSSQEFSATVREAVEEWGASILMIDGISGYRLTLSGGDDSMLKRLHALGRYLNNMGVTTIFVDETKGIIGEFYATQENISYLADNIVFLRHLELHGELRKAIGVLKKRTTDFERTLREFEITDQGVRVGEPLTDMRGILHGMPEQIP